MVSEGAGNVGRAAHAGERILGPGAADAEQLSRRLWKAEFAMQEFSLVEATVALPGWVEGDWNDGVEGLIVEQGLEVARHHRNDGKRIAVLEAEDEAACRALVIGDGADAIERLELKAAGAVVLAVPVAAAEGAAGDRGSIEHAGFARIAERCAEGATVHAAFGIEQVHGNAEGRASRAVSEVEGGRCEL